MARTSKNSKGYRVYRVSKASKTDRTDKTGKPYHRGNPKRAKIGVRFPDTDPELEAIVDLIAESGLTPRQISSKSGLAYTTIRRWLKHEVRRPQHRSLEFVANVCGKTYVKLDIEEAARRSNVVDIHTLRRRSLVHK